MTKDKYKIRKVEEIIVLPCSNFGNTFFIYEKEEKKYANTYFYFNKQ